MIRMLSRAVAVLALMLWPVAAHAQGESSRNIEIVVPYPAGGVTDLTARALADGLSKLMGRAVVVINKDGAAGTIGTAAVAIAPPDGYMLGFSAMGTITGQPHLRNDLRYNAASFDYVCQVTATVTAIVVPEDSPYRTLKELFDQARNAPEKLTYGHPGPGSIPHLQMIDLSSRAGVSFTAVPFRGDAPARNALMGKHIDMLMSGDAGAVGNLRALAVIARDRMPNLPNVPTTQELGLGEGFVTPFGLFAAKGVPADVLSRLRSACAETVKSRKLRRGDDEIRQTIQYLDGPAFADRIAQDSRIIGDLVSKMPAPKK